MTEHHIQHIEEFAATDLRQWEEFAGPGRSVRDYANEYNHKPDLYFNLCADFGIRPIWITADDLISAFGDQAYHRGCRMVIEALRAGDSKSSRELAKANIELMRRGYHKKLEIK